MPAQNNFDLLSTAVHEIGHALGVNGGDFDVYPHQVAGREVTITGDTGGHIAARTALMLNAGAVVGVRRLPSAIDIMAVSEDESIRNIDLPRKDFFSPSGVWQTPTNWLGGRVPDAQDDVFIRYPNAEVTIFSVSRNAQAKNLSISDNALVELFGANHLTVGNRLDLDSSQINLGRGPAGISVIGAGTLAMNRTARLNINGGIVSADTLTTHIQSQIIGHGDLIVADQLDNNGLIRAAGGDLLIYGNTAPDLDLDGAGTGRLVADTGDITVNGTPANPIQGTVVVGTGRTITFNNGWSLGGSGDLQFLGGVGTIRGDTRLSGEVEVHSGTAIIDGPLTFGADASLSSNTTMDLMGRTSYVGGSFEGRFNDTTLRQRADARVPSFSSVDINVGTYDWDGSGLNIITVEYESMLTINADRIEQTPGDGFDGTIRLDGGSMRVATGQLQPNPSPPPLLAFVATPWRMEGTLILNEAGNTPVVEASDSRMLIGDNDDLRARVSVIGHGVIEAPVTFERTSQISITSDSRLELAGHSIAHAGARFSGGGELYVSSTGTLLAAGDLGDVMLINAGLSSPGSSPGVLQVPVFSQEETGTLLMELAGGFDYDRLIADIAELDGTLHVMLLDGFVPKQGHVFDLFDVQKLNGSFATINVPQLPSGQVWDLSSLYVDGTIRAVPEPIPPGLLGAAILVLLQRRRSSATRHHGVNRT
jgi:hypothetical protein